MADDIFSGIWWPREELAVGRDSGTSESPSAFGFCYDYPITDCDFRSRLVEFRNVSEGDSRNEDMDGES
jgi:hypothetical protein